MPFLPIFAPQAKAGSSTATIVVSSEGAGVARQAETVIAHVGPPRRAPEFLIRRAGASLAQVRIGASALGRLRRWGASVTAVEIAAAADGRMRTFVGPSAQGFAVAGGFAIRTQQAVRIQRHLEPVPVLVVQMPLSRAQRHLLALARQPSPGPSVPSPCEIDEEAEILELLEVA